MESALYWQIFWHILDANCTLNVCIVCFRIQTLISLPDLGFYVHSHAPADPSTDDKLLAVKVETYSTSGRDFNKAN